MKISLKDIPKLISDRHLFEKVIFTPLRESLEEIKNRRKKEELNKKILDFLSNDIPEILLQTEKPKAVLARQVITSNYEIRRFIGIVDGIKELDPLLLNHSDDKFVTNNPWKYRLGKLSFYMGRYKDGYTKKETLNIIDFNKSNGKKIKEIQTIWGQSLEDFHREIFIKNYPDQEKNICYISDWFNSRGGCANKYYESLLSLFIQHGILFENFLTDTKEKKFTEEVFLPAFISCWNQIGYKPLIVPLEPTDIEGDSFWMHHPYEEKKYVLEKIKKHIK